MADYYHDSGHSSSLDASLLSGTSFGSGSLDLKLDLDLESYSLLDSLSDTTLPVYQAKASGRLSPFSTLLQNSNKMDTIADGYQPVYHSNSGLAGRGLDTHYMSSEEAPSPAKMHKLSPIEERTEPSSSWKLSTTPQNGFSSGPSSSLAAWEMVMPVPGSRGSFGSPYDMVEDLSPIQQGSAGQSIIDDPPIGRGMKARQPGASLYNQGDEFTKLDQEIRETVFGSSPSQGQNTAQDAHQFSEAGGHSHAEYVYDRLLNNGYAPAAPEEFTSFTCGQLDGKDSWRFTENMTAAYYAMRGPAEDELNAFGTMLQDGQERVYDGLSAKKPCARLARILGVDQFPPYQLESRVFEVRKPPYHHGLMSRVVPWNVTDFNPQDISDGGDPNEGNVSPCTFGLMAEGSKRWDYSDKPLPPLPKVAPAEQPILDAPEEPAREQRKDRLVPPDFREQLCEETGDRLTGSYHVTTDPSIIREPFEVPDLRQFKGPFGETFARMHPVLADRFTKLRYQRGESTDSTESVYGDDHVYTQSEIERAFQSPTAESFEGIAPEHIPLAVSQARQMVDRLAAEAAAAQEAAERNVERLDHLRQTYSRANRATRYILANCEEAAGRRERAKLRRSMERRLRALHDRRTEALAAIAAASRAEGEARAEIEIVSAEIKSVCQTVRLGEVEDVMKLAESIWDVKYYDERMEKGHGPRDLEQWDWESSVAGGGASEEAESVWWMPAGQEIPYEQWRPADHQYPPYPDV